VVKKSILVLTNIYNIHCPAIVTDNSTPLTNIAGCQPGIGSTVGEGLNGADRIGLFNGRGIGQVRGRTALQPSLPTGTVIEDGHAVAWN
jgi:hypothetical protein